MMQFAGIDPVLVSEDETPLCYRSCGEIISIIDYYFSSALWRYVTRTDDSQTQHRSTDSGLSIHYHDAVLEHEPPSGASRLEPSTNRTRNGPNGY